MLTQVRSWSSSLVSSLTLSPRRASRASRDHVSHLPSDSSSTTFCSCPRSKQDVSETSHTERPDWYKALFAWSLNNTMRSYEAEIADYKKKLFDNLTGKAEKVLELGVGTGPNLKYYADNEDVFVFGMDPNEKMEKYACESAREAGLKPENFRFVQGVGEAIPLDDDSVDAVVATLVLCSVSDVTQTLAEIKRVLKPGGIFLFIEHVAAEDGSFFRHVQNVFNPIQHAIADGCHLTRKSGLLIQSAGFNGGTEVNTTAIYSFPWIIRPHVYGTAYKQMSTKCKKEARGSTVHEFI